MTNNSTSPFMVEDYLEKRKRQLNYTIDYEKECEHVYSKILIPILQRRFGEIPEHYLTLIMEANLAVLYSWIERIHGSTSLKSIFEHDTSLENI